MPGIWQSLITSQVDGPALSNSTAATSILHQSAKLTLPANYLDYIGRTLRIKSMGRVSNIVTTPGTLTLDIRAGTTVVFSGSAMQFSTTAHTNVPWIWETELTVRVIGGTANLMGQGMWFSQAASVSGADPTTGHSFLMTPNSAPAVGNNIDSTAAQTIDMFATFSIANSGNAITVHQFAIDSNVT